jgi:hypothetical protein
MGNVPLSEITGTSSAKTRFRPVMTIIDAHDAANA